MKSGAAAKYKTMSIEELCSLEIPAAKNSVLFLWATVPLIREAFQVMQSWGFEYKTTIFWRKIMSKGMGWWWRGQVEELLFGIKGKIKAFGMQEKNIIEAKVGRHSRKPNEFRELIERATPNLNPKLEMFATEKFPGWDPVGYEIDGLDINESLKLIAQ